MLQRSVTLAAALALLLLLTPLKVRGSGEGAKAYIVMEAGTGCVLSEENADAVLPVGSLAKLMTAYLTALAIEEGRLTPDTVCIAGDSVTGTKGAVIWLEKGDSIPVSELLTGLLAGNAGDAAAVLAEAVSGDAAAFVRDMNSAAFDLGMRHTRFTSPQGFDDPESYSTARDMGLLCCAVLKMEVLEPHLTVWRTFIRDDTVEIVNENTLTRTLDGCRGLKAAHSEAAGQCLAAACQRDDMVCTAVVLGCGDEDARFSIAKKLLNESFSSFALTLPSLSEEFLSPMKLRGGTESAVLLTPASIPELAVRQDGNDLTTVMVLPDFMEAPVRAGQRAGEVHFYHGDTHLWSTELRIAEDVPEMTLQTAVLRILRYLCT